MIIPKEFMDSFCCRFTVIYCSMKSKNQYQMLPKAKVHHSWQADINTFLCSLLVTMSIFPIKLSWKHQLPFPTTTMPVLCTNTIKSLALGRRLFFAMGACGFVPGLIPLGWWEQAGSSLSMPWPWLCLSRESPCQMDNWPWSLLPFCRISRTKGTVHPSKLNCYSTCS